MHSDITVDLFDQVLQYGIRVHQVIGRPGRIDAADGVLLAVGCDQRAWKGRSGLKPELAELVAAVLGRASDRVVTLLLGAPGTLAGLSDQPATVVACWGDAPFSRAVTAERPT